MQDPKNIDPDAIVDRLYDIALDTDALYGFIEAWNEAGLDASEARRTIEKIDQFDHAYEAHLKRAETFLQRDAGRAEGPDFDRMLARFEGLAAFVVDVSSCVVAMNDGARHAFGVESGQAVAACDLPPDTAQALTEGIQAVLTSREKGDKLLKLAMPGQSGTSLFQLHRLAETPDLAAPHVLVVTTHFHWQPALGQTLEEVFVLTPAEQGVVRALVEGRDAKSIAAARGTSEGTVRGQIKSILAKMNARTQSEVIRLVLSLRDVSQDVRSTKTENSGRLAPVTGTWLQAEVWKPFNSITLPDGRRMDYHDMGPVTGAPILFTHMGYCMARWTEPMIKLCFQLGLRVIVPIRAGYGHSQNVDPKADIMASTRADTLALLEHLGIKSLPYAPQSSDLIFAVDLAVHHPDTVSDIVGVCARPSLPGDRHYAAMGRFHRFFLSTARHAPHLLKFTTKAAVTMCKRIGVTEMFKQMNRSSPSDMSLLDDAHTHAVLVYNAELAASRTTDISQAYAMEVLASEAPWDDLMVAAKATPTQLIMGNEDPATDIATIAEYRDAYPWIEIDVLQNAGQLAIYNHFETILPRLAAAAKRAQG